MAVKKSGNFWKLQSLKISKSLQKFLIFPENFRDDRRTLESITTTNQY